MRPTLLVASAVAALLICGAGPATALSCLSRSLTAPEPGAVDVPTNTRVWCSHYLADEPQQILLTDADGVPVSGTHARLSSPQYPEVLVFRPDSELEPNTEYHVNCPHGSQLALFGEGEPQTFSFFTGPSSLSKAPPIPNVATVELHAQRSDWGDSHYATFQKAGELGNIIVLDLGGSSTLNPEELSGSVSDPTYLATARDYLVGSRLCSSNWDEAALGASTTVALGAFDLTGRFSGWSDTVPVTLPSAYTDGSDEASSEDDSEPTDVPSDAVAVPEVAAPEVAADDVGLSTTTRARHQGAGCHFGVSAASPFGAAALLAAGVAGSLATLAWRVGRRRPRQPSLGARKSISRADHTERNGTPAER